MAPGKKKKESWQSSKGQSLLWQDVRNGTIPPSMDWQIAFNTRPKFAVGVTFDEAKRLFEGRLKAARKRNSGKKDRADEEERLMKADRIACPPPPTNHRGEPRWYGSAAQMILKDDVAKGNHLGLFPADYYALHPEFQPFFPSTIAAHVIQEEKLIKFNNQYKKKQQNDY